MHERNRLSGLMIFYLCCFLLFNCGTGEKDSIDKQPTSGEKAPHSVDLTPVQGGTASIALEGEPIILNPVLLTDINSQTICVLVFDSLISHDAEMNYVSRLAESWEVSDDKLMITFHLRKNVKWHDGKAFTSEDVEFTYNTIMNPKLEARNISDSFSLVESVDIPDPYTFRVIYRKPFAPCFESWETLIIPKHVYNFTDPSDFADKTANMHPIGTGPFMFKQWTAGKSLTLARNPNYFHEKPYLDNIVFHFVTSKDEALSLALDGPVDIAPMDPTQWQLFTQSADFLSRFTTLKINQLSYDYIAWNADGSNPFFSDALVRKAMTYALDRQQIIERILYGLGKPMTGPFIPDSWACNPLIEPYPFSLKTASDLLSRAGWDRKNKDEVLAKGGKSFTFSMIVREDQEIRKRIAEMLRSNLDKIGVRMDVKPVAFKEWVHRMIDTHDYEASIGRWNVELDPDPYNLWFSGNYEKGFNFVKFNNARVDKLVEAGRITFDRSTRQKLYWEVHEIIHNEQPYTFLYVPVYIYACSKRIQNITSCPKGLFNQYPGVISWFIPRELQ